MERLEARRYILCMERNKNGRIVTVQVDDYAMKIHSIEGISYLSSVDNKIADTRLRRIRTTLESRRSRVTTNSQGEGNYRYYSIMEGKSFRNRASVRRSRSILQNTEIRLIIHNSPGHKYCYVTYCNSRLREKRIIQLLI